MNKDNAKDMLPLVQALAEGKVLQVNEGDAICPSWVDRENHQFSLPPNDYRIKPSPSYRPWTFEEVPVGVVVATEDGGGRYVITAVEDGDDDYVCVFLGQRDEVDTEELLANYVMLDGKPCGVAV